MNPLIAALLLTAAPAPAAAPAKASAPAEIPSSCSAQAKPLIAAARDALMNARQDEALSKMKDAVTADPKCGLAKSLLGRLSPGADGKTMIAEAATMTAGATEVEKLLIEEGVALSAGDMQKAYELGVKARDLAPTVTTLQLEVAFLAGALDKFDDMLAAAKKATELEPKNGAAWNQLGYAYSNKKQWDDAVTAFKKYTEISPTEANPHDSLADALLWSGKLDEAAAEYQKAIDAKMVFSHSGIATVKAIKGDWAGARAALDALHDGSVEQAQKVNALMWKAAAYPTAKELPDALKIVDQAEKEAVAAKLEFLAALAPIVRGDLLEGAGKHADALKQYALAEKAKLDTVGEGQKRNLNAWRLAGLVEVQARTGKAADAEKTAAKLEELFKATPADVDGQNLVARARGFVAFAKKDFKGAVAALSKCTDQADMCQVTLAEAQDKAGDKAAAEATRTKLLAVHHRDAGYLLAIAKVTPVTPGRQVAAEESKKK